MLKTSLKLGHRPAKGLLTLRFSCSKSQEKLMIQKYVEFLSEELTIDKAHAKLVVQKNKSLLQIPQKQITRVCRLLKKYDIEIKGLSDHIDILTISPLVVENRIMAFQELGVSNITSIMLSRMVVLLNQSVLMFKACTGIPCSENPIENLVKHIKLPPDAPSIEINNKNVKVFDHYRDVSIHFFQHRLQISPEEAACCFHAGRPRYKSFRFLQEVIDLVEKELDIPKTKFTWLIKCITPHPENVRKWFYEVEPIAGESIISLIKKQPSILTGDASEVKHIREVLRERDISEKEIVKFPLILRMSVEVVRERLDSISKHHAFQNITSYHSDILKATYMYREMQIRAKYLKYIGMGDPSTTFLLTSKTLFERYTKQNYHSEKKVMAIKLFLQKDRAWDKSVGQNFKKHPYWKAIPETQLYKTYLFLKKRFSPEDITANIQILLYSESSVGRVLEKLDSDSTLLGQYQYTQCQLLALCLYYLEKDVHFSGDGIWAREKLEYTNDDLESLSDCEDSDSCDLDDRELDFHD